MKNGIYGSIGHKEYHALDRVSNSYLDKLAIYPAKARIKTPDTAIFAFGRAFHVYVLEQKAFEKEVAVSPEINRRTNQGKEDYRLFVESNEGKTVITLDEFASIKGMKEKIMLHPLAAKLIVGGLSEQTVIWTDEETGIPCKARPDKIPTVDGVVVDLKKTRDASPHGFQHSLVQYRYPQQAGMYLDGIKCATGGVMTPDCFAFIAVEDKEPYRTEVYTLDAEFISWGLNEYKRLLLIEKECRDKNFYPHYQNAGAVELTKPSYLQTYD